jgi:YegS/Rv2252/BmrU family lipid kinase
MSKTLLFLVNPKAGRAEIKNNLLEIIDLFVKFGWKVVVRTTQYAGELQKLIQEEAGNYDMVVCSGGDGTLNEAVGGLLQAEERPRLGYIPAGTTNDFAVSLDIPRNALQAAEAIVRGRPFSCDVGLFGKRHFVYVAAFGAFTEVSYSTPQQFKNAFGRAAYILEGIKHLAEIKPYRLTVEHDGETISGEFIFGMVSNSISVGGFKMNGRANVSMNDGLLEVLLVKTPRNPMELQSAIGALLLNDFGNACLYSFHTSALRIFATEEISWTLDGEFGGNLRDVQIQVQHKAYEIMVPAEAEEMLDDEALIQEIGI